MLQNNAATLVQNLSALIIFLYGFYTWCHVCETVSHSVRNHKAFRFNSFSFIPQMEQLKLVVHLYNVLSILIITREKIHRFNHIYFINLCGSAVNFKNFQLFIEKLRIWCNIFSKKNKKRLNGL